MEKYESLEKLYYKKQDIVKEYAARINNPCTYKTELKIYPILKGNKVPQEEYKLFCLPINELLMKQEKICLNSKQIIEISSELPKAAHQACITDIMSNEIVKTNGLEGVHSTKKEIYDSMSSRKRTRFSGIINKYIQITEGNIETIDFPEEIRKIYDDIFADDILTNPENKLDGKLFRKEGVYIHSGMNNVHTGDSSEELIIKHLEDLIEFRNRKDVPFLIKASIVHYYFEYIHPFYDGNGRFGRFLFSMYLARKVDIFTGLSLSYSIFGDKNKYSNLFKETSSPRNKGELTFFVLGMLEFILNGQKSIIEMLKDKKLQLDYAEDYLNKLKKDKKLEKIETEALFIYMQNYIFAKENPLTDDELLPYIKELKSIRTLRKYLNRLTDLGLITTVNKKPIVRTASDQIKNII